MVMSAMFCGDVFMMGNIGISGLGHIIIRTIGVGMDLITGRHQGHIMRDPTKALRIMPQGPHPDRPIGDTDRKEYL